MELDAAGPSTQAQRATDLVEDELLEGDPPAKRQKGARDELDIIYEPKELSDLVLVTSDKKRVGVHKVFIVRYSKQLALMLNDFPGEEVSPRANLTMRRSQID